MFKKCKENHCLNREMVEFFSRQLNSLKELSKKVDCLAPEIIADQLMESVALLQKRIIFAAEQKPNQQFHDYVADFYEDKLDKMRNELSSSLQRNKKLEVKVEELSRQLKTNEESMFKTKSVDMSAINQNLNLKNELVHSQQLILDNQHIMEAQNNLINELKACVIKAEEREAVIRLKFQEKGRELDEAVSGKKKRTVELMRQFENETKRMDKECRQLQLQNLSLVEEKDALQSEVILKGEQIKLLSKKIYDQNMVISKYERELQFHQGVLEEEKIDNNRAFEENKSLKLKLRDLEKDCDQQLAKRAKELKQIQERVSQLTATNTELTSLSLKHSSNCDKYALQLKSKREEISKLEIELGEMEVRAKEAEKECKKWQRKSREGGARVRECEELLVQRDQQIKRCKELANRLKKDLEQCGASFEREKQIIKKDLECQFGNLIKLNKEMLESLETSERESRQIKKECEGLGQRNVLLSSNMEQLSQSFEEAKLMINKIEQEKQDLDYLREQLESKVKQLERRNQELQKANQQHIDNSKQMQDMQAAVAQMKKHLKEKEAEVDHYKTILAQESLKQGTAETESVKALKEELCKKEFLARQLNSKLNEVQSELRQLSKKYEYEKESMTSQIKEMERIIQDNFDHSNGSNRMIEPTYI